MWLPTLKPCMLKQFLSIPLCKVARLNICGILEILEFYGVFLQSETFQAIKQPMLADKFWIIVPFSIPHLNVSPCLYHTHWRQWILWINPNSSNSSDGNNSYPNIVQSSLKVKYAPGSWKRVAGFCLPWSKRWRVQIPPQEDAWWVVGPLKLPTCLSCALGRWMSYREMWEEPSACSWWDDHDPCSRTVWGWHSSSAVFLNWVPFGVFWTTVPSILDHCPDR